MNSKNRDLTHAVKCGITPSLRPIRDVVTDPQTLGEEITAFAARHLVSAEGPITGPLLLMPYQRMFIEAIYDSPNHVRKGILSLARRNGKSLTTAAIMAAYLFGPLATKKNAHYASAAGSREQSAIVFRMIQNMLNSSPDMQGKYKLIPSKKQVISLLTGSTFTSISSDAKTGLGQSFHAIIHDEAAIIKGEHSDMVDMLVTSQGNFSARDNPVFLTISTQAASDDDYFSRLIDDAITNQPKDTVLHLYAADENADVFKDEDQWYKSNPGLGIVRSHDDLKAQLQDAKRIEAKKNGAKNLLLNMRVSVAGAWLSADLFKQNGEKADWDVFVKNGVHIGIDLSILNDLSSVAIAAIDDQKNVHLKVYSFTPSEGLEDRAKASKVPLDTWVKNGVIYATPGKTISYEFVADFMADKLRDITIHSINYDRYRIDEFKNAISRTGTGFGMDIQTKWEPVGMGYISQSPRIDTFEALLLDQRIKHGMAPDLTLAARSALIETNHLNERRLTKNRNRQGGGYIDPIMAAIMAVHPLENIAVEEEIDVTSWIA